VDRLVRFRIIDPGAAFVWRSRHREANRRRVGRVPNICYFSREGLV
jgi:hypothetical protein